MSELRESYDALWDRHEDALEKVEALENSCRHYQEKAERLQRTIDGMNQAHVADLVDALDHIARVCRASGTQTRRIRWIEHRAKCALEGGDWRELDLPPNRKRHAPDSGS